MIEWLVVDDGSTDDTVAAARREGVDHIVRLTNNKGLAAAFQAGLDACLKLGADVIVNTDADNQYYGPDVQRLVEPILEGRADMVVGDREVSRIKHFSPMKKRSAAGRLVGRTAGLLDLRSGHDLRLSRLQPRGGDPDARGLAVHLHARDDHPGRQDAGSARARACPDQPGHARVAAVPLDVGLRAPERDLDLPHLRPVRASADLLEPAGLIGLAALAVWIRFLVAYVEGNGKGHVQSLILGAVLFIAAAVLWALGVIGDLLAAQRVMTPEDLRARQTDRTTARHPSLPLRTRARCRRGAPGPATAPRRHPGGRFTRAPEGERSSQSRELVNGQRDVADEQETVRR